MTGDSKLGLIAHSGNYPLVFVQEKRDTGYVLGLTVLGIGATYGTSGALTAIGVPMTFNAAMNSIPVLLLAIGVDYGLHVVKRVREEYQVISSSTDRSVESVGAMDKQAEGLQYLGAQNLRPSHY